MSLREKIKRRFTSKKSSDASDGYPPRRKDIEYYKPHEIPKSKYRGKVDKLHQATLDAYTLEGAFASARRRASNAFSGTFSPRGTNAQSTAPSAAASASPSTAVSRRPSYAREPSHLSTTSSVPDSPTEDGAARARSKNNSQGSSGSSESASPSLITDATDSPQSDGISRILTANTLSRAELPLSMSLELEKTSTAKQEKELQYDSHFSPEDLERAMTQATLRPRRGTVVAMGVVQPGEYA
jgi:hypothetical protein